MMNSTTAVATLGGSRSSPRAASLLTRRSYGERLKWEARTSCAGCRCRRLDLLTGRGRNPADRRIPGWDSQKIVSCSDSRSLSDISTTAGRPCFVMWIISCVLTASSTRLESLSFASVRGT